MHRVAAWRPARRTHRPRPSSEMMMPVRRRLLAQIASDVCLPGGAAFSCVYAGFDRSFRATRSGQRMSAQGRPLPSATECMGPQAGHRFLPRHLLLQQLAQVVAESRSAHARSVLPTSTEHLDTLAQSAIGCTLSRLGRLSQSGNPTWRRRSGRPHQQ